MKNPQSKGSHLLRIIFILIISVIFSNCSGTENEVPATTQNAGISNLLEKELQYLENNKRKINVFQRISINGQAEEKKQDVETLKKALQTLKEMDLDKLTVNTSFSKTTQNLTNSENKAVLEENYKQKEGEKSSIKQLTIYYNGTKKRPENIVGIYILKHTVNKLFSSRQTHFLRFNKHHLQKIEMNGRQEIIFTDPVEFRSIIEIKS